MNIGGNTLKDCSLTKLKNLLNDKEVYGISYTNSFFSRRYLCRSHVLSDKVDVENKTVRLGFTTRLEEVGMMEIENTLDVLEKYKAGDAPGFTPEGLLDDGETNNMPLELVSVTRYLYSLDLLLIMENPQLTYQDFTIAGEKFTLVNINHQLGEDEEGPEFEQTVSLLFAEPNGLSIFSHFYNKKLSVRDTKLLLDLIVDENITGRAIRWVKAESSSGVHSVIFPYDELISAYTTTEGNYVFGSGTGYVTLPREEFNSYRAECTPQSNGAYEIELKSSKNAGNTIRIFME
ncbi:hypothetical protein TIMEGRIFFIN_170 [Bacillus phage vB_BspH_TimeGriffin]|nr:hypothetical protein TIMEGRIFFIN_170 [Bacillus phage vB_BspH_TimeGriffin]